MRNVETMPPAPSRGNCADWAVHAYYAQLSSLHNVFGSMLTPPPTTTTTTYGLFEYSSAACLVGSYRACPGIAVARVVHGTKVSFGGSGTLGLKIVIPVENYPQKRRCRLAELSPPLVLISEHNIYTYHIYEGTACHTGWLV